MIFSKEEGYFRKYAMPQAYVKVFRVPNYFKVRCYILALWSKLVKSRQYLGSLKDVYFQSTTLYLIQKYLLVCKYKDLRICDVRSLYSDLIGLMFIIHMEQPRELASPPLVSLFSKTYFSSMAAFKCGLFILRNHRHPS